MESIIQKFYNSGNGLDDKFTQFGAFPSVVKKTQTPVPLKPMITTINPAIHQTENDFNMNTMKSSNGMNGMNTMNTMNTMKLSNGMNTLNTMNGMSTMNTMNMSRSPPPMTRNDFLRPKPLNFASSSDLLYNNPIQTNKNIPSEYNSLKKNVLTEAKKNATKMQMMEEKMKNLELKSQRLEVINDFFFDMFENNLVKEEIQKQRENAARREIENEENEDYLNSYTGRRRKNKKIPKGEKLNLNKYDKDKQKEKEDAVFDAKKFQEKTAQDARDVLDNIKKNVSNYLVEEELKKNERLQDMGEAINELKSQLVNQLEKIQMAQKHQMEKIAFCLLNSGDDKIEDLALRLFSNENTNYRQNSGNLFADSSTANVKRGSIFTKSKKNIFNSGMSSSKNSRGASMRDTKQFTKVNNASSIPEEKNDEEEEEEPKRNDTRKSTRSKKKLSFKE